MVLSKITFGFYNFSIMLVDNKVFGIKISIQRKIEN